MDVSRYTAAAPDHAVGVYAAWSLGDGAAAPVDQVWVFQGGAAPSPHRVFPSGEPSIAVRRRRDGAGALNTVDIVICSAYSRAFWYFPEPFEELIALRLRPEDSARALGVAAPDHQDAPPGIASARLCCSLDTVRRAAEGQPAMNVAQVMARALGAATSESERDPVSAAAQMIRTRRGAVSIADVASAVGVTDRHLRRRFRDRIGCSPKNYARRARLSAAIAAADRTARPDWAAIACDAGFFDQAHLIDECRRLAGLTPAAAHRERTGESVFCNTAIPA